MVVEFRILGPLEAAEDGQALPLGGQKQRAVLALLLLHAGEVVSTDRLIDALWGERPPRTAATSLQNSVSQLRKLLGSLRDYRCDLCGELPALQKLAGRRLAVVARGR